MGRKTRLTPDASQRICAAIRAGAFDWVAAEANGVSRRSFYDWLAWGEKGREPYSQFSRDVAEARAQARLAAEIEVRRGNPLQWLRLGPGRDRKGAPGWTEQVEHKLDITVLIRTIAEKQGLSVDDPLVRAAIAEAEAIMQDSQ